jgi:hypothetical protein
LNFYTFEFLCKKKRSWQRKDIHYSSKRHFRLIISLETRVVVALAHFSSGKFLQMVGEVYGIDKVQHPL